MQVRKARAIGIDGEHRAVARSAATHCAVPYRVLPDKINPAIGLAPSLLVLVTRSRCRETMQVRKTRAIGVDGEHRAIARTAACICRPIQGIAR